MGEMQLSIKTAFLFSVSIYVAIAASPLFADVLLSFLVSAFFWVLNGVCRIEIGQMGYVHCEWTFVPPHTHPDSHFISES